MNNTDKMEALILLRTQMKQIPSYCRKVREQSGLYLKDIATIVGTTEATVSRWETGETLPTTTLGLEYAGLMDRLIKAQTDLLVGYTGTEDNVG